MKGARGRGTLEKEKPPILGMLQRTGEVVLHMLANVQQVTIGPSIRRTIVTGTVVYTDEYDIYNRLPEWGYEHHTVCHSHGEYARDDEGKRSCDPSSNCWSSNSPESIKSQDDMGGYAGCQGQGGSKFHNGQEVAGALAESS